MYTSVESLTRKKEQTKSLLRFTEMCTETIQEQCHIYEAQ